jgi:hypothetical protein
MMIGVRNDTRFCFQDGLDDDSEGSSQKLKEISETVKVDSITAVSTQPPPADEYDVCCFTPEPTASCEVQLEATEEGHETPELATRQPSKVKGKKKRNL